VSVSECLEIIWSGGWRELVGSEYCFLWIAQCHLSGLVGVFLAEYCCVE